MRDVFKMLPSTLETLLAHKLKQNDAEQFCLVELGLRVAEILGHDISVADTWTLFSGYPFAEERGLLGDSTRGLLRTARYSLWNFGRSRSWQDALEQYEHSAHALRGYSWPAPTSPARRKSVGAAPDRWAEYDAALFTAPPFAGKPITFAAEGKHWFFAGRNPLTVDLPTLPAIPVPSHDLNRPLAGAGQPIQVTPQEILDAAAQMDRYDRRGRVDVLTTSCLLTAVDGRYDRHEPFTINRIAHLLGIVGSGKSTLRDVLTYLLTGPQHGLRVTVVVGDVAEQLDLVKLFRELGRKAVPVLGSSTRELHAQRLHRRLVGRGKRNALSHGDDEFDHLSTACPLSGLLEPDDAPLAYADSPCTRLQSKRKRKGPKGRDLPPYTQKRLACSFWGSCPRHQSARDLVEAEIWVATPASLVDSAIPWPQNAERIRYLEAAARSSDLIIIDEADRVQMQLDQVFAPAITLAGEEGTSWLDEVNRRKIQELLTGQRTQLSNRDVENWTSALNTATTVTDRLYAMLVGNWQMRKWVSGSYFNAWKLHGRLVRELFPPAEGVSDLHAHTRTTMLQILDEYRRNPFGDKPKLPERARGLVRLTTELLPAPRSKSTRARLRDGLRELVLAAAGRSSGENPRDVDDHRKAQRFPQLSDELTDRFEFTLLLSALEPTLALMTGMWPRVQAALNLGFSELHRRPLDYGPVVPESPMGNVLGFEFLVEGRDNDGVRSGELRFFRCSGVGRALLTAIPGMAEVDGRPGTHVLLMSGSSWAVESSRYHVLAPVTHILKPEKEKFDRIRDLSTLRFEFVEHDGRPLTLSGAHPDDRAAILHTMALALTTPDDEGSSRLERELASLEQHRRHLLLLTGSYKEAAVVADAIYSTRMKHRVLRLLADDEKEPEPDDSSCPVLRRGDVGRLANTKARILVAPLLSLERGHNIMAVNEDTGAKEAAIGTVYFLARPNPRPDDLALAVHAINDWITRAVDNGMFHTWVTEADTMGEAGSSVRSLAYEKWYRFLGRTLAWSRLDDEDRTQVTWDLLVLMWQVIGRLVRGGVEARVVLVDAAFAPNTAAALCDSPMPGRQVRITDHDTPETSLLLSIHKVVGECLKSSNQANRQIAEALYEPFWKMIDRFIEEPTSGGKW